MIFIWSWEKSLGALFKLSLAAAVSGLALRLSTSCNSDDDDSSSCPRATFHNSSLLQNLENLDKAQRFSTILSTIAGMHVVT